MSTQRKVNPSRRSRRFAVAAVTAVLATAAAGIAALRNNTAHAIHPVAAASAIPGPDAAAGHLPDAWRAPASDASVPSAHDAFKVHAPPDSDALVPTF